MSGVWPEVLQRALMSMDAWCRRCVMVGRSPVDAAAKRRDWAVVSSSGYASRGWWRGVPLGSSVPSISVLVMIEPPPCVARPWDENTSSAESVQDESDMSAVRSRI